MKKILLIMVIGALNLYGLFAVEIDINGSFENIAPMPDIHVKMLKEKNFELDFKKSKWIKNWELNMNTNPAKVSLPAENAPDGTRYIRLVSEKTTHFPCKLMFDNGQYTLTFMARGEEITVNDATIEPKVALFVYIYDGTTKKYKRSLKLESTDVESQFKEYTFKIPADFKGDAISLAFETIGQVDLDNIKLFTAE